jgi:hypothetical protein
LPLLNSRALYGRSFAVAFAVASLRSAFVSARRSLHSASHLRYVRVWRAQEMLNPLVLFCRVAFGFIAFWVGALLLATILPHT